MNFHQSNLFGLNLKEEFFEAAASFLSCSIVEIPFKIQGISVGANPMRKRTWNPILDSMRRRLSTWSDLFLSVDGLVKLISLVLNSILLYMCSFYKAPKIVKEEMIKIQSNFLWGIREDRSICWVSWDKVCMPEKDRSLGMQNIEAFNLTLMNKWR